MKNFVKENIPGAKYFWRKIYAFYKKQKSKRTKLVFTEKYRRNGWGSEESVSGYGSEIKQTSKILVELPGILSTYSITSVLDIPCGDFNWMRFLKYPFSQYIGADIVNELIDKNNKSFPEYGNFKVLNLITDPLPDLDLIFCRDCLVHFSYQDIQKALRNIKGSNSKYLMTTTWPGRKENKNILTGDWRTINLQISPFFFPEPLAIIVEGSTEGNGEYKDKSLALWRVSDIPKF